MINGFTDGNPVVEFLVFVLLLSLSSLICRLRPIRNALDSGIQRICRFTRERRALRELDLLNDLRKMDIIRIGVGVLAFTRYGSILLGATSNGDVSSIAIAGAATFLSFLVAIGWLTPLAILLLMSSANTFIDNTLGASTLGTMVMSIVLLMLFIAPAGRTLSIDAILASRFRLGRIVQTLHAFGGGVSQDRLLLSKLAALMAYYCICLYSVLWHLRDEAWTSGLVIVWLTLSQASNPHFWRATQGLFKHHQQFYLFGAYVATAGMFAWYFMVLPSLFLGRILRTATMYWGLIFFLISTFLLPLSLLGYYELLLWFALFVTGPALGSRSGQSLMILFDDRCNLCDRTVRTLSVVDLFGRLEFRPLRRNRDLLAEHGISFEQGLTDLVGIDNLSGRKHTGFDLYVEMAQRLILLWALVPVMILGRITLLGPMVYGFVAKRRTRIFGVCHASAIPERYIRPPSPIDVHVKDAAFSGPRPILDLVPSALIMTFVVLVIAFVIRLPLQPEQEDKSVLARLSRQVFGASPLAFGIGRINVFNSVDLSAIKSVYRVLSFPAGIASTDVQLANTSGLKDISRVMSMNDAELYWIEAQARAASRQNLGCDATFFSKTASHFASAARRSGVVAGRYVVIEIARETWPTVAELHGEVPFSFKRTPVCRAVLDIATGDVSEPLYLQEGVDQAMRDRGYEPIISAAGVRAALSFPCLPEAALLNTRVDTHAVLAKNLDLVRAARALFEDKPGRFQIDCLAATYDLLERWPEIDDTAYLNATRQTCEAGASLVSAMKSIISLPSMMPDCIGTGQEQTVQALSARDCLACARAASAVMSEFWKHVLKPGAKTTLLHASSDPE